MYFENSEEQAMAVGKISTDPSQTHQENDLSLRPPGSILYALKQM